MLYQTQRHPVPDEICSPSFCPSYVNECVNILKGFTLSVCLGAGRHGDDDDDADVLYKLKQGHSLVAAVAHQQFWMVRVLTAITVMPNSILAHSKCHFICHSLAKESLRQTVWYYGCRYAHVCNWGCSSLAVLQESMVSYRATLGMKAAKATEGSSSDINVNLTGNRCALGICAKCASSCAATSWLATLVDVMWCGE